MGAGISTLVASAYPHLVSRLVLLEGYGPLARSAHDSHASLHRSIEARLSGNRLLYPADGKPKQSKSYPSVPAAAEARMKNATLAPGKQRLSFAGSLALTSRALRPASVGVVCGGGGGRPPAEGEAVAFRHDARLLWPSAMYMTAEAVAAVCRAVACPVLAVQALDGWPPVVNGSKEECDEKVREAVRRFGEGGKRVTLVKIMGSHHNHLDLPEAEDVAGAVAKWLLDPAKDEVGAGKVGRGAEVGGQIGYGGE